MKSRSDLSRQQSQKQQEDRVELKQQEIFGCLSKINYSSLSSMQSVMTDDSTLDIYIRMIKQNQHQFNNKIVLHLASDCNCLYSIFAAQAGAKLVYCVLYGHNEKQFKNKFMMEEVIRQNKYSQKIKVLIYRQFKIQEKVDIIIGEPMGANLFYDGMIQRIIEARDLFLKQNTGVIYPHKIRYKCGLISDEYQKDQKFEYWDQVYGINMKQMKNWVAQEPSVHVVDPTLIISQVKKIFQFDLYKVAYFQVDEIKKNIYIKPLNSENLTANGLAIWFQVDFVSPEGQIFTLDASPWCQQTRWSHMTLYTRNEWKLKFNQAKKIEFYAKKNHASANATIKLKVDQKQQVYTIT